jgi:tetratricopeptide (TPR) repeat protein
VKGRRRGLGVLVASLAVCLAAAALLVPVRALAVQAEAAAAPGGVSADALFREGCDLYEKGDFASALADFEEIKDEGIRNATVYFNLGNCYYRQGQMGKAVANYRRSLLLAPGDVDVRVNLNIVRRSLGAGDTTAAYASSLSAPGGPHTLSPRQFQTIFFAAYYLAAVFLLGVLFLKPRFRRPAIYALAVSILVAGFAMALSRRSISQIRSREEAVVVVDRAPLKSGPGSAFEEISTLPDGFELRQRARSGMWIEVQLRTGEVGWVREQDIEAI